MSASEGLTISSGESAVFSVAGMGFRLSCELPDRRLRLPESFRPFLDGEAKVALEARVGTRPSLEPLDAELLFDPALHWRALTRDGAVVFELVHPPSRALYCRMSVDPGFSEAEILFDEGAWLGLGADPSAWLLPHPLDQLLLAPALALRGACLFHACGAVLGGEALVFAGHSGGGKTTLARLLASEGAELLSDERVAVALGPDGRLTAYGTPWPGEGDVYSPSSHPLGGLFVLAKSDRHGMGEARGAALAARAIVPYYLPEVASRALGIVGEALARHPLRELRFARAPGLASLLSGVPA